MCRTIRVTADHVQALRRLDGDPHIVVTSKGRVVVMSAAAYQAEYATGHAGAPARDVLTRADLNEIAGDTSGYSDTGLATLITAFLTDRRNH